MTGTVSPQVPILNSPDSTEEPKVRSAIITLRDALNAVSDLGQHPRWSEARGRDGCHRCAGEPLGHGSEDRARTGQRAPHCRRCRHQCGDGQQLG
jgi:hypothetical protein